MDTYEKKYNEAIERMRKMLGPWRELAYNGKTFLQDLEYIFPELRESEDEKTRTLLVALVQWAKTFSQSGLLPNVANKMLSYLEKQEETPMPNSTELIEMWHKAKAILKEKDFRGDEWRLAQNAFMDGFARGTCVKFEKQKEQKPNYCHHEVDETGWTEEYRKAYYDGWNNCNMQHEQLKADQKPAEWSEEDKNMWTHLNGYLNGFSCSEDAIKQMVDWFYELPNRFNPQPKQ